MKRKVIFFAMLISFSFSGHSQGMPVYDNTNFITLGKSLIESAKQTSQLLKTVQFLKAQKERLEQVSRVIKQIRAVKEIIENHQELYLLIQTDLQEILSSPYIREEEVDEISTSFNSVVSLAQEDLKFIEQLLTSNLFHMTDAERLQVIEQYKERSRELLSEIALRKKRYRTVISFRMVQSRINQRENNL